MASESIPARQKAIEVVGLAGVAALEGAGLVVVHLGALTRAVAAVGELAELEDGGKPAKSSSDPKVVRLTRELCTLELFAVEAVEAVFERCGLGYGRARCPLGAEWHVLEGDATSYAVGAVQASDARQRAVLPVWLAGKAREGAASIFVLVFGGKVDVPDEIDGCPIVVILYPE